MSRPLPLVVLLTGLVLCAGDVLRAQGGAAAPQAADAPSAAVAPQAAAAPSAAPPAGSPAASAVHQDAPADSSAHNLGEQGLAIDGWDPVAYFPEGGGRPQKGDSTQEVALHGARYRFASEAHRRLFEGSPGRYVPAFGGWCAYAMAQGRKVEVDPESFVIEDGRLMLFYKSFFNDTRASWVKDTSLLPLADVAWTKISGEAPRGDKAAAAQSTARHTEQATGSTTATTSDPKAATPASPSGAGAPTDDIGAVVGKHAPEFTLKDAAGVEHTLSSLRGRVVVLDFWATWCGPCKLAMPGMQKLHDTFKDRGVVVIGIDGFEHDPAADPAGYMRTKGYTYQLLLGGQALEQSYAIEALPTFVVIDGEGDILARETGKPDDDTLLPALIEKHAAPPVH